MYWLQVYFMYFGKPYSMQTAKRDKNTWQWVIYWISSATINLWSYKFLSVYWFTLSKRNEWGKEDSTGLISNI